MDRDQDWEKFWDGDDVGDEIVHRDVESDIDALNDETFGNVDEWNEDEHEAMIARDNILSNTAGSSSKHSNNRNGKHSSQASGRDNVVGVSNSRMNNVSSSNSNQRANSSDHFAASFVEAKPVSAVWSPIAGEDFFKAGALSDTQKLQAKLENMHIIDKPIDPSILAAQPQLAEIEMTRQRLIQQFVQEHHMRLKQHQKQDELLQRKYLQHQEEQRQILQRQYIQHIQQQELEQKQKQELFVRQQLQLQQAQQQLLQQTQLKESQLQRSQIQQSQIQQIHLQHHQQHLRQWQTQRNTQPQPIPSAKVLTVEELERQMLAERKKEQEQKKKSPVPYALMAVVAKESDIQPQPRHLLSQEGIQHMNSVEKRDRAGRDRTDRDRTDKVERLERTTDRPNRAERLERSDRFDRHDRMDCERGDRSGRAVSNKSNHLTFGTNKSTWTPPLVVPPQAQLNVIEKSGRLHSVTAMHDDECLQDRMPTKDGFCFIRHAHASTSKHDGVLNERERAWLKKCQQKIQADYDNNLDQDYYYLLYSNRSEMTTNDGTSAWSSGPAVPDKRFVPRERLLYNIGS